METRKEEARLAEGGPFGKNDSSMSKGTGSPVREQQGKPGYRRCISPGDGAFTRARTEPGAEETVRRNFCADGRPVGRASSVEKHRCDKPRRDGSSSDTESDFYEEIDVSCTPESMDYPTTKGGFELKVYFSFCFCFVWLHLKTLNETHFSCIMHAAWTFLDKIRTEIEQNKSKCMPRTQSQTQFHLNSRRKKTVKLQCSVKWPQWLQILKWHPQSNQTFSSLTLTCRMYIYHHRRSFKEPKPQAKSRTFRFSKHILVFCKCKNLIFLYQIWIYNCLLWRMM